MEENVVNPLRTTWNILSFIKPIREGVRKIISWYSLICRIKTLIMICWFTDHFVNTPEEVNAIGKNNCILRLYQLKIKHFVIVGIDCHPDHDHWVWRLHVDSIQLDVFRKYCTNLNCVNHILCYTRRDLHLRLWNNIGWWRCKAAFYSIGRILFHCSMS